MWESQSSSIWRLLPWGQIVGSEKLSLREHQLAVCIYENILGMGGEEPASNQYVLHPSI